MSETGMRQVIVFVRVNNMDTLVTERQETFLIDVPDPGMSTADAISAALEGAVTQWESESHS